MCGTITPRTTLKLKMMSKLQFGMMFENFTILMSAAQPDFFEKLQQHIDPTNLKMKVYVAAHVFSNTFGNLMLYYSEHGQHGEHDFLTMSSIV